MFDIQENLKKLPDKPGVYLHKDKLGQVIYVGKAVSLKNRVRQYFQSSRSQDAKVRAMVSHIAEFEYITTDTEMEALILENNLIKKYMPQYNVLLRDDKTYPYIKVTLAEDYPRVLKTRRVVTDGAKYFGPFTDAGAVNQIIDLLNDSFSLKRCSSQQFPDGFQPCLNYHIQKCRGICRGVLEKAEYRKTIQAVLDFLGGKDHTVLEMLETEMQRASEALEFEKAAQCRDYIMAVKAISEKQKVVLNSAWDMDVVLAAKGNLGQHVVLFFIRQGKLSGRESYHIDASAEERPADVVQAFIQQYYSAAVLIPRELLVDQQLPGSSLLEEWLSDLKGSKVKITLPQKGEKKAFLDLAKRDVVEMTKVLDERAKNEEERNALISESLTKLTGATSYRGWRLEAYDISNTNGLDSVGGMVVFENGKPVRRDYRRFKIRTVEGANDYASMQEVLRRRMKRALSGEAGFDDLPDLFLIDGGEKQVAAVKQVLDQMDMRELPVAGMVKDAHHKTRGLLFEGVEINLKDDPALLQYIGRIQDEVHRFSVAYHRGLRDGKLQKSALDDVEGIGEKRKQALFKKYGSLEAMRKASLEELAKVPGMNRRAAEKIWDHLHNSIVKKPI